MEEINWQNKITNLEVRIIELNQEVIRLQNIIDGNQNNREYIFERGDIIMDLSKKYPKLILGIKDGEYEFMELKSQYIKDIFNQTTIIEKGSICNQPADIVEKHYSIYEFNNFQ